METMRRAQVLLEEIECKRKGAITLYKLLCREGKGNTLIARKLCRVFDLDHMESITFGPTLLDRNLVNGFGVDLPRDFQ